MFAGSVEMDAKFKELAQIIVRNGDLSRLTSEAEKGDFDINHQDQNGNTLLHVATKRDNAEAIFTLLQCPGIDPNLKNKHGHAPLFDSVIYVKTRALQALLTSEKLDSKNYMRSLIRKRRNAGQGTDTSGRHAIIIANSDYTCEYWEPLDGPMKDRDLLQQMFQDNYYIVHEIIDTENVLVSVRSVMNELDRSTVRLMHLVYTGRFHSSSHLF